MSHTHDDFNDATLRAALAYAPVADDEDVRALTLGTVSPELEKFLRPYIVSLDGVDEDGFVNRFCDELTSVLAGNAWDRVASYLDGVVAVGLIEGKALYAFLDHAALDALDGALTVVAPAATVRDGLDKLQEWFYADRRIPHILVLSSRKCAERVETAAFAYL